MTKKKGATSKTARVKAVTVANPARPEAVEQAPKPPKTEAASAAAPTRAPFRRPQSLNFAGVGRNDICPCGSGKRFKNCHGH
jgi:preprotein translocase subunit SecA